MTTGQKIRLKRILQIKTTGYTPAAPPKVKSKRGMKICIEIPVNIDKIVQKAKARFIGTFMPKSLTEVFSGSEAEVVKSGSIC